MSKTCIAVDIGASNGRIIAGNLDNNKLSIEEIHRFENYMEKLTSGYFWNTQNILGEIQKGFKKCSKLGIKAKSIGVDTWGVDYVLLDKNKDIIGKTYAYRDHRTDNSMEEFFKVLSKQKIYNRTGIQFLQINSIYQLYAHFKKRPNDLLKAKHFMMMPDYINYILSGTVSNEYTNATTTQIINVFDKKWDEEIINSLGINKKIFKTPIQPGTILGKIRQDFSNEKGIENANIVAVATHDTGSAVAAIPSLTKNYAYISSGTWSLLGIESLNPIVNIKALKFNYTNEGGINNTIRFLKNIMGLWLLQNIKKELPDIYSYSKLEELAKKSTPFNSLINPNDNRFLNPDNMIVEIQNYCRHTNQEIPKTPGELTRCILESLAFSYKQAVHELENLTGTPITSINIVGGGCNNNLLNQLCADFTGINVMSGPSEATALGNIITQFIANGDIANYSEARNIIKNSFDIKKYFPNNNKAILENWEKFINLL